MNEERKQQMILGDIIQRDSVAANELWRTCIVLRSHCRAPGSHGSDSAVDILSAGRRHPRKEDLHFLKEGDLLGPH